MGRDEDYYERQDRERHEEYVRQMYQDWDTSDSLRRDDRTHAAAVEAARDGDTNAVRAVFDLYSTWERDRKGAAAIDELSQSTDTVGYAKVKAKEAENYPGLSAGFGKFLSLLWEKAAARRELEALGSAPQGADYARAQGLKTQLEELEKLIQSPVRFHELKWSQGTESKD